MRRIAAVGARHHTPPLAREGGLGFGDKGGGESREAPRSEAEGHFPSPLSPGARESELTRGGRLADRGNRASLRLWTSNG